MTKQEKIGGEIDTIIRHWTGASISADWAPLYGGCNASQDVVLYLDSQGVVIKGMMLTFEGEPVGFEVVPLVEK